MFGFVNCGLLFLVLIYGGYLVLLCKASLVCYLVVVGLIWYMLVMV